MTHVVTRSIYSEWVSYNICGREMHWYIVRQSVIIIKSRSTASARLTAPADWLQMITLDWLWFLYALCCTQQSRAPNIDRCALESWARTNTQTNGQTDGRTDGRTLPILLSPRFAVDNDTMHSCGKLRCRVKSGWYQKWHSLSIHWWSLIARHQKEGVPSSRVCT